MSTRFESDGRMMYYRKLSPVNGHPIDVTAEIAINGKIVWDTAIYTVYTDDSDGAGFDCFPDHESAKKAARKWSRF